MPRVSRRQALAALGGSLLAGCLDRPGSGTPTEPPTTGSAAVSATVDEPPEAGDWPLAKRDAAATAGAPGANGPSSFPLETQWTYETEQAAMWPAVVADGTLLALTSHPDAVLASLDPATGNPAWTQTHDRLGHSPPALRDDRAFVPWGYYQTGEYVDALATSDGARAWRATVPDAPSAGVLPVGDTVYVGLESAPALLGLSAETGEEQFRHRFAEPAFRVRQLAVVEGTVYAAIAGMETDYPDVGFVVAVDPVEVRVRWHYEVEAPVEDLVVVDGTVYAGSGAGLAALDAETGDVVWAGDPFDGTVSHVAVRDGTVVGGTLKGVRAFDAASGDPGWHHDTVGGGRGLVIAGDTAYAAGKVWEGESKWGLLGLALDSGTVRWRQAPVPEPRSLSVAAGNLYLGTDDGRLLAYA